jgi:hypothetical protein
VHAQVAQIAQTWRRFVEGPTGWLQNHVVDRLKASVALPWMDLRPRSLVAPDENGLDLLTFLSDEAHAMPRSRIGSTPCWGPTTTTCGT